MLVIIHTRAYQQSAGRGNPQSPIAFRTGWGTFQRTARMHAANIAFGRPDLRRRLALSQNPTLMAETLL